MASGASANEIDAAITLYKYRITVPSLHHGQLEMRTRQTAAGPVQYPFALTGAFARVFSIKDATGKKRAVRCFYNPPPPEYQQRYTTIAHFFSQQLPSITADLKYHDKGIHIRTKPPELVMPVIDMEWVEGETLITHVDQLATKKDKAALRQLATRWVELIRQMRSVGMAHGDLSGTNVMVRRKDSSLVLIDYDGVYLPQFAGQFSEQAGNPQYQHPDLQNRPYDDMMDNFSALLIFVALFALSEQPDLWRHPYCIRDSTGTLQSEELLFRVDDLRNPSQSRLFAELGTVREPEFQRVLGALRDACYARVEQVPDFLKVVDPYGDAKDAFQSLEAAIKAKDDRAIVKAAEHPALKGYAEAQHPHIMAEIQQARSRVQQADELTVLLARGEEEPAQELWLRGGFNYTSIARTFTSQMQVVQQRLDALNRLKAALLAKDDVAIVDAWDEALFRNYKPAQPYTKAVDEARKRVERTRPLLEALKAGDDVAVERLWLTLKSEPSAQALKPQVDTVLARLQQKRKVALQDLAAGISADDDAAIARIATDPLVDPNLLNSSMRARIGVARGRVNQEKELKQLLTGGNDEAIIKCWYAGGFNKTSIARPLAPQIAVIEKRVGLLQKLTQALALGSDPDQDRKIISAWDDAVFKGYPAAEAYRQSYEAARARLARLVPLEASIKQQDDATTLQIWDSLSKYGPAQAYRKAVEQAQLRLERQRQAAIKKLEQAINLGDDRRIVEAWSDPALKDVVAVKGYEPRVRKAQERVDIVLKLEQLVDDPGQEDHLLKLWEQHALQGTALGKPLQPRIEYVRRRRSSLASVEQAVDKSNDNMLLSVWDDRLFAGYAPAQRYEQKVSEAQQRLRNVTSLRAALSSGNDKLVMVLWDNLKVSDLPDAATYDKDVRASKLRWLAGHVPTNLQGKLENGVLNLTWDWPEGLTSVGVNLRAEGGGSLPGTGPLSGKPGQMHTVSYAQHLRQGGYTLHVGKVRGLTVSVVPLVWHGKGWLLGNGIPSAHIELKPICTIPYQLAREQNGEVYLDIDASQVPTALPTLLIVASTNRVPPNAAAGTMLGTVGAGQGVPGPDGKYHVPINVKGWATPSYLTLFTANPADSAWLTLVPKGGQPVQFA